MSAQPAYPSPVDYRPRFLEHGLPSDPDHVLTLDDLAALPEDPYWKYDLLEGALIVSSEARAITWHDLETFPDLPHWKCELLEGTLIVSPNAPGLRHQTCILSLGMLFRQVCLPELQVVIAPFDYTPGPRLAFQPDVLIARRPIGAKRLEQAPVLVVEVLSPSNRSVDKNLKRLAYEKNGIEHYWIVEPAGPSIQALQRVDGAYTVVAEAAAGELFEVKAPIQLSIDPWVLLDD